MTIKILGIDYGEKKVGLSLSEGQLAAPIGIELNNKVLERKLEELCRKEKIEKIVVGIAEGRIAKKQKEFGGKIAQICNLPVEFWDETLTTQEAQRQMIEIGKTRKSRRREDAISAAIILQSYLEAHQGKTQL